eukprot:339544-Rhodomonas_salina.1
MCGQGRFLHVTAACGRVTNCGTHLVDAGRVLVLDQARLELDLVDASGLHAVVDRAKVLLGLREQERCRDDHDRVLALPPLVRPLLPQVLVRRAARHLVLVAG